MRIGINTLFYIPGEVGGSETYLLETFAAMLEQAGEHEFVLFTNREGHAALAPRFGECGSVKFQALDFHASNRYARIVLEQTRLPLAARRWKLDVLWSPGYTAPFVADCPQALSILDMQYKTHPQDLGALARLTTDVLVQTGARRARRLLAISEFSKQEIVRHTRAAAEKVVVTPLAADPAFGEQQERPQAFPHDRPYLLCVANTYPHKNVHALVAAYGEIQGGIPHDLVIVGKPRLGESDVRLALAGVPQPERVRRVGGLDRAALIALYQHASLFVFPSLYEGFGLPVLEAMLAGTPVLTTRMGSIPEVGGDEADYFDPAEAGDLARRMLGLLKAKDENKIARARARAMSFSWRRTAELTLEALERAAAG